MAFKDIVGNANVKNILRKALKQKKLPNSLLFSGPKGVGKRETSLVVAKALNCLKKKDDACEDCSSCKAINSGNHPDVIKITAEKNVLKIEQMRDVKSTAHLKPMVGRKRVFIVLEAEKMNVEASNSLLKILEEPPPFSQIILVTQNPHLILPTIKSRCQKLYFPPISRKDILQELRARGIKEEKAKIISLLVRGDLEQALSLDWDEIQERRRAAWNLFLSLLKNEKTSPFIRRFSSSQAPIKNELTKTLETLSSFCRDLILIKEKGNSCYLMNPDYEEEFRKAERLMSLERMMDFQDKVDFVLSGLQKNLNVNILVSSLFADWGEEKHA